MVLENRIADAKLELAIRESFRRCLSDLPYLLSLSTAAGKLGLIDAIDDMFIECAIGLKNIKDTLP